MDFHGKNNGKNQGFPVSMFRPWLWPWCGLYGGAAGCLPGGVLGIHPARRSPTNAMVGTQSVAPLQEHFEWWASGPA